MSRGDPINLRPVASSRDFDFGIGDGLLHRRRQHHRAFITAALRVNYLVSLSSQLDLRTISKAASKAVEAAVATVDHSDIRGSEPHNRDPSGATSD
jgi:hypothetical protein